MTSEHARSVPDDPPNATCAFASASLTSGDVLAVECGGDEFVLWRGRDGRVRGVPRWCPHLDHDLADGYVVGDELVCAGHAWAFDGDGHAYKRNEFGRVDPKGTVDSLQIREHDATIEARPSSPS
jgi:phenylpropionate dioxygenase-like ring-hydroxylating dioxygenase large terminal subunit